MGYMRHHAIVVTSWNKEKIAEAHQKAVSVFGVGRVSGVIDSDTNYYQSFFVAPDGSKEGWERSNAGDDERAAFKAYMRSTAYADGSSALKWVEVQYGDDGGFTFASDDSDAPTDVSRIHPHRPRTPRKQCRRRHSRGQ